jgi:hypothetical protein
MAIVIGLIIIALLFLYVVFNIHFTTDTSNELLKGLIVIVGFVIITLIISFLVDKNPSKLIKSVFLPLSLVGLALALTTYLSVVLEYVPVNDIKETFNIKGIAGLINRDSNIQIPLRNSLYPLQSNITLFIYSPPRRIYIQGIKLSTTTDTLLSYQGNFANCKNQTSDVKCYNMLVYGQHNLAVSNSTIPFTINIFYKNNTGNNTTGNNEVNLQNISLPFNWSIRTLDMSQFSYFWIVMIGVIVSRLLTMALDKLKDEKNSISIYNIHLGIGDIIWIGFSFIIALLIFQSFNAQVHLTFSILTNMTLAFAFGFGFDKTLEVAQRFGGLLKPSTTS